MRHIPSFVLAAAVAALMAPPKRKRFPFLQAWRRDHTFTLKDVPWAFVETVPSPTNARPRSN